MERKSDLSIEWLKENKEEIKKLLLDSYIWKSLDITYHPPRVHRLYTDYKGFRINLHKIFPCDEGEALLHPHPWPSVMKVLAGSPYEMGIGHCDGNDPRDVKIDCRLRCKEGFTYEMLDKDGWHYVRPINLPSYSIMVTGKPWNRVSIDIEIGERIELDVDTKDQILEHFKEHWK